MTPHLSSLGSRGPYWRGAMLATGNSPGVLARSALKSAFQVERRPAFPVQRRAMPEALADIGCEHLVALRVEDAGEHQRAAGRQVLSHRWGKAHQRTGEDVGDDQVERRPCGEDAVMEARSGHRGNEGRGPVEAGVVARHT